MYIKSKESKIPIRSDVETYKKFTTESMALDDKNNKVKSALENNRENVQERSKIANEWKEKGNSFVKLKDYKSASE